MKRRPLSVRQDENGEGGFWYVVKGRNGRTLTTSEMYPTRSNSIRAARAFIAAIEPVPLEFSYWVGRYGNARRVVERVRFDWLIITSTGYDLPQESWC